MARSLPLTAYLALRGAEDQNRPLPTFDHRPRGTVVWAVCANAAMLEKASILEQALLADGDQITVVKTCPLSNGGDRATPVGRRELKGFLDHWKPALVLFVGDALDPVTINQVRAAGLPCILIEATEQASRATDRNWIPGLTRAVIGIFDQVFAVNEAARDSLIQAGVQPARVKTLGTIATAMPVLPYSETERRDFAQTVGTRPVWLAAETGLSEVDILARAHHQASRRSHRLLLIIALRQPDECEAVATALRDKGFDVAIRSRDQDVLDSTQIYVVDGGPDLGLWYRASPVTYLGESLNSTPHRHPYEAASLGSALVYGPKIAPYQAEIAKLAQAGGCMAVRSADALGDAVETLLSADKVASIAHAAWDVTTQGADVAQQIATLIQMRLDAAGA